MRVKRSSWHYKLVVSDHKYGGWSHDFDEHDDSRIFYIMSVIGAVVLYIFSGNFRHFYRNGSKERKRVLVFFED